MRKRRKKHIKENNLLLEEATYTGEIDNPTEIYIIQYDDQSFKKTRLKRNEIPNLAVQRGLAWIQVKGLNDSDWLQDIADKFNIPQLGLQDVLQPQIIARIEEYDNLIMASLKYHLFSEEKNPMTSEQVSIVMEKDLIITFQETDSDIFDEIEKAIEKNTAHLRVRPADYIFLLLINHIFSNYIEILNRLENTFELMEEELLDTYNTEDDFRLRLKEHRQIYQTMKQSILPLKDGINKIQVDRKSVV